MGTKAIRNTTAYAPATLSNGEALSRGLSLPSRPALGTEARLAGSRSRGPHLAVRTAARSLVFFADTCALASSAGLKIRLVFLGRPPSHRLVSTKTTDGSCTMGRVDSRTLSAANDAIAKGSAERHHPPNTLPSRGRPSD